MAVHKLTVDGTVNAEIPSEFNAQVKGYNRSTQDCCWIGLSRV